MKAKLVAFGELQIEGERYTCDVVIESGRTRRRRKGPSKPLRDQFGHTPPTSVPPTNYARGEATLSK